MRTRTRLRWLRRASRRENSARSRASETTACGAFSYLASAATRQTHRKSHDEHAEEGIHPGEKQRPSPEHQCLWGTWSYRPRARAVDEVVHRAEGKHHRHRNQLDRQRTPHGGSPERRRAKRTVPSQPAFEMEVDETGEQQSSDGPPAHGAEAKAELLEEPLPELWWFHGAEDRRPNQAEEEHPANPQHGGEHVDRHVGVLERRHHGAA